MELRNPSEFAENLVFRPERWAFRVVYMIPGGRRADGWCENINHPSDLDGWPAHGCVTAT
jgi:hypothetical protein